MICARKMCTVNTANAHNIKHTVWQLSHTTTEHRNPPKRPSINVPLAARRPYSASKFRDNRNAPGISDLKLKEEDIIAISRTLALCNDSKKQQQKTRITVTAQSSACG